jgi:hypothetical protein
MPYRVIGFLLLQLSVLHPALSQNTFPIPLSPRNANYTMDVSLDPESRTVSGSARILWRNIDAHPAHSLQFHLYMNAFKNNRSTLYIESLGRIKRAVNTEGWGWIDVLSISNDKGKDLTGRMRFIQPDDSNIHDQTVIEVPLDHPVLPGETIQLTLEFITKLPRIRMRTGYSESFYFIGQWFPKIGVFMNGNWNCHQFHANSEFFADFGVYRVSITVPSGYTVGATGNLVETRQAEEARETFTFLAEDVHDFAWTASPDFIVTRENHLNTQIIVLCEKDHLGSVSRVLISAKQAMDFLHNTVGEYPYHTLTIVLPPTGGINAGGMEYPTLITGVAHWLNPKGFRLLETVIIHEFGHNYWYGMVASNEFEEAWLDEGINSYFEERIMDRYYGKYGSLLDFPGIRVGNEAWSRSNYIGVPRKDKTLRSSWTYYGGSYSVFSYTKPALMLKTLENLIGVENMDRIMRTYFQKWKFRHPTTQDFIDVVNSVTGTRYNGFFETFLNGSLELDYSVESVRTGKKAPPLGVFEIAGQKTTVDESMVTSGMDTLFRTIDVDYGEAENLYTSVVRIHRRGEAVLPVDILMVFANGDSVRESWDGEDRWVKYILDTPSPLKFAVVDPERKLVLDSNYGNNSRTVKPDKRPVNRITSRLLFWFENLLHLFGFFG